MEIYRYRNDAMKERWLFLLVIICVFALPATMVLKRTPGMEDDWWEFFVIYGMWLSVLLLAIYDFYLWRIARTAVFTLDSLSIGYHDCYVRQTIAWSEVAELTPHRIRARNGKAIYFKPGIQKIEGWQALTESTVKNASLSAVPRGKGPARFWSKQAQAQEAV